ncbi:hypothetical protein T03_16000 [Trichinella britovi]|uniref:Uncharacterized protein n=1 Tax=Trichinella britovi TaxID=45882 RepID=A0A0V1AQP4_TRIBR|nr:hypothetical protein T03_16000 [Trichinella britovi]
MEQRKCENTDDTKRNKRREEIKYDFIFRKIEN